MFNGKVLFPLFFIWIAGCAEAPVSPEADPRAVFESVCGKSSPGAGIRTVKGDLWMKARSKEASGQFPAAVEVDSSGHVRMEVTNLLGGVEARIRVEGAKYFVEIPKEKPQYRKQEGAHSWGGIPLHWASSLFQGRIPCPATVALADAAVFIGKAGELHVETQASLAREPEIFVYRLKRLDGKPWPESLNWERKGLAPIRVDFHFEEPEAKTGSPKKWEAKSPYGEVKVRWKNREVNP